MQFKLISIVALSATLAAATTIPRTTPAPIPASQCSTGPVQCCNESGKASDSVFAPILALIGVVLPLDALVGTGCASVPVVGVGSGAECDATAFCCQDNSRSLISLSCIPVIIDL